MPIVINSLLIFRDIIIRVPEKLYLFAVDSSTVDHWLAVDYQAAV